MTFRCHPAVIPIEFGLLTHCLFLCWLWLLHQHCALFLSHTNNVYGALQCALILMITTPIQKVFFLLSLRTSSLMSSSWIASTLMWWRNLSSCFLANFPISFVTISIWRSLWRSAFMIYQDASTMFLSSLFLNRWMMSVLLWTFAKWATKKKNNNNNKQQ